jgi:hypothetical protein
MDGELGRPRLGSWPSREWRRACRGRGQRAGRSKHPRSWIIARRAGQVLVPWQPGHSVATTPNSCGPGWVLVRVRPSTQFSSSRACSACACSAGSDHAPTLAHLGRLLRDRHPPHSGTGSYFVQQNQGHTVTTLPVPDNDGVTRPGDPDLAFATANGQNRLRPGPTQHLPPPQLPGASLPARRSARAGGGYGRTPDVGRHGWQCTVGR